MKTLIVQSYRTRKVAPWITACMDSVRRWAAACGYHYEFIDDRFFDYAPAWVRKACGRQILPVTDVARLYLLRERLAQDFERVAWVDADVLVFADELFRIDEVSSYTLCREVWLDFLPDMEFEVHERVNNAVTVMCRAQPMLDFLIFAAEEVLRGLRGGALKPWTLGTELLTGLSAAMPLRLLDGVGLFAAPVIVNIGDGGGRAAQAWAESFGNRIGAANLCASLLEGGTRGLALDAQRIQRAVDELLRTRGETINTYMDAAVRKH